MHPGQTYSILYMVHEEDRGEEEMNVSAGTSEHG